MQFIVDENLRLLLFQIRFADKVDMLLMIIAAVCAMAHGCGKPLLWFVLGDITRKFIYFNLPTYVCILMFCTSDRLQVFASV